MGKRTFILRSKDELNWPGRSMVGVEWVQMVVKVKTFISVQCRMASVWGDTEPNLVMFTYKLLRDYGPEGISERQRVIKDD